MIGANGYVCKFIIWFNPFDTFVEFITGITEFNKSMDVKTFILFICKSLICCTVYPDSYNWETLYPALYKSTSW